MSSGPHGPIFLSTFQAQKEENSLGTDERILQLLQSCEGPVKTIDIAKALGFKTAKEVCEIEVHFWVLMLKQKSRK